MQKLLRELMAINFYPAVVNEHDSGAYLGKLESTSTKVGSFELYFVDQSNYLNLIGDELFLKKDWQFDFETQNIFNSTDSQTILFVDFSNNQIPIKLVYEDLDFDWVYADINFIDKEEGPLSFQGRESPWTATSEVAKSDIYYIDALLPNEPVRWNSDPFYHTDNTDNSPLVLTFSFPGTYQETLNFIDNYADWKTSDVNVMPFNELQMEAVRLALSEWSKVANIRFVEVEESHAEVGELRFAFTDAVEIQEFWGWAGYPSSHPSAGDVWVESSFQSDDQWERSKSYNFSALMHETGHALGLDHPHEGEDTLSKSEDFTHYTLMSYNDSDQAYYSGVNGKEWNYLVSFSPMVFDIAAIQHLYGSAIHNETDTLYFIESSVPFVRAIWDSDGNDTIDVGDSVYECIINLEPGSYSTIPCYNWSMVDNLGIAFETIIENASGGINDDLISGNSEDNILNGNSGNDILKGGDGNDVFDLDEKKRMGIDEFHGQAGDDVFVIDHPLDRVVELENDGIDLVWVGIPEYKLPNHVEGLKSILEASVFLVGNSLDNEIRGNIGADSLNGIEGNDTIFGGAGDDRITGGLGNDKLFGDSGSDTFIFELEFGHDIISDFNTLEDIILYDGSTIDILTDVNKSVSDEGYEILSFDNGSSITFKALDRSVYYENDNGAIQEVTVFQPSGVKLDYGVTGFSLYESADEQIKIFSLSILDYYITLTNAKGKVWSGNPIGVNQTSTGYELILETVGRKGISYSEIAVSSDGQVARKGSTLTSLQLIVEEVAYDADLNQDGEIGLLPAGARADYGLGTTSVYEISGVGHGILADGATYLTPLTDSNGRAWSGNPIGVSQTFNGYELILEMAGRKVPSYSAIAVSSEGVVAKKGSKLTSLQLIGEEVTFGADLNKDGEIGFLPTGVRTDYGSSTISVYGITGAGHGILADGATYLTPLTDTKGNAWSLATPIGVEATFTGYNLITEISGKKGSIFSEYTVTSSGEVSKKAAKLTSLQLVGEEVTYNADLNQDGSIGLLPSGTRVDYSDASTSIFEIAGVGYGILSDVSTFLIPLTDTKGNAWSSAIPIGVEETTLGYNIITETSGKKGSSFSEYSVSSDGEVSKKGAKLNSLQVVGKEVSYNADLNQDGSIGLLPAGDRADYGSGATEVYEISGVGHGILADGSTYLTPLTDTKGKAWSSAAPIGVEETVSGYNLITEISGKKGSTFSEYSISSDGEVSKKGAKLTLLQVVGEEVSYNADLNQDGSIGLLPAGNRSDYGVGATEIFEITGVGHGILADGATYLTPLTDVKGKAWSGNSIGVNTTSTGYELILETAGKKGTSYSEISVTSDGVVAKKGSSLTSLQLIGEEVTYGADLNQDGEIGLVPTGNRVDYGSEVTLNTSTDILVANYQETPHSFVTELMTEGFWYAGVYTEPSVVNYNIEAIVLDISADGDMDVVMPVTVGYRSGLDTRSNFIVLENSNGSLAYNQELTQETPFVSGSIGGELIYIEYLDTDALVTVNHNTARVDEKENKEIPWSTGYISILSLDPFENITNEVIPKATLPWFEETGRDNAVNAHSHAVGDVNGDGLDDIVVGDLTKGVFVLEQNLLGSFDYNVPDFASSLRTKGTGSWNEPTLASSEGGILLELHMDDFDGDGSDDLVIGWGHGSALSRLFFNDGLGNFSVENSDVLPASIYGVDNDIHLKTMSDDFDQDGDTDLVVLRVRYEPYYGGNYLQFLENDGSGQFSDSTVMRFGDPSLLEGAYGEMMAFNPVWQLIDINADGANDIVGRLNTGNFQTADVPLVWMNNGEGYFTKIDIPAVKDGEDDWFVPGFPIAWADFDNDGLLEYVSRYFTWTDMSGQKAIYNFNTYELNQNILGVSDGLPVTSATGITNTINTKPSIYEITGVGHGVLADGATYLTPLTETKGKAWSAATPIAVEETTSGYNLITETSGKKGSSFSEYSVSSDGGVSKKGTKLTSLQLIGEEVTYSADLNQDGSIGLLPAGTRADHGSGATSIYEISGVGHGILAEGSTYLTPLTDTKGNAWSSAAPIGVVATATGYNLITETVAKKGSTFSEYSVSSDGEVSKKGAKLTSLQLVGEEVSYNADLNQDGYIGNVLSYDIIA